MNRGMRFGWLGLCLCTASLASPAWAEPPREFTGNDGAPMLLVPEGEFLYGDKKQRLSLPAFYMDKYEVTTKRYAAFLQVTSRAQPTDWSQQVLQGGSEEGDRPVVWATWHDADAYCRHYGKRLPTEQEWEKAERGTDGRKYPWGNKEPEGQHALFGVLDRWNGGYWTLAVVGSHKAGASPYGIQDLVGNVWEWTSSDYDGSSKVFRGGSYALEPMLLRSALRGGDYPTKQYANLGFRCVQDAKDESKSSGALNQVEREQHMLQDQERQVAEQLRQAEIQRLIDENKRQIDGRKQMLEVGRESTGQDGAPMLLVSAGEFLYGDMNERLSLPAFYIDKFEVTTKRYSAFLQVTSRAQPSDWSQQVALVGSGEMPVVQVTWHDADTYCRHYGKRLPTEQEWEKAARGTDGRIYPWGNEKPTMRHALFGRINDFGGWGGSGGYVSLVVVGSYEAGKSPYGVYDLVGNAWEWTSSDYDSSSKVFRGGVWSTLVIHLESTHRSRRTPDDRFIFLGFRCAQDAST